MIDMGASARDSQFRFERKLVKVRLLQPLPFPRIMHEYKIDDSNKDICLCGISKLDPIHYIVPVDKFGRHELPMQCGRQVQMFNYKNLVGSFNG